MIPDLARSWAIDTLGVFEPDYVWHDLAQAWRTPGVGEQHIAAMLGGPPAAKAERMVGNGISPEVAERLAAGQDEAMQACVLRLYRDAAQPAMARRGEDLGRLAERPGLVILATEDHFVGDEAMRRRAAERAGAQVAVLRALGHWWMVQDPDRGAGVLLAFWAGLDG